MLEENKTDLPSGCVFTIILVNPQWQIHNVQQDVWQSPTKKHQQNILDQEH